jgi:DNA helicase IV
MSSLIVDGQPGTGKTIIASHRAAYLVNEETPGENALDGKILVVGPTPAYSRHVRDVILRLTGDSARVVVLSLPELMRTILGLKDEPSGESSRTWQDVDLRLGTLARAAVQRLRDAKGVTPTTDQVYEYLRQNGPSARPLTRDNDWGAYLRRLPSLRDAKRRRSLVPLLAVIKWEVARQKDLEGVELIIVDEAQDVSALEWFLLQSINETDAWTLLGDLNQRRSDHTLSSWTAIVDVLGLDPADVPVRHLSLGYRSTKPILSFANRLLPRAERPITAFQQAGPEPTITRVRDAEAAASVSREVDRLLRAYPLGTVAIITLRASLAMAGLRGAGWATVRNDPHRWQRSGREVAVLPPDEARGLEFDAVLVFEPSGFPQNYGRLGPLYTALTRANRELAVLHTTPLPDALRR